MNFEPIPLPYTKDALAPHVSAETVDLHYEKHHRGYVSKLREQIEGKPEAELELEQLIQRAEGDVFDNAAQIWNHDFYWQSLSPGGGGKPAGEILQAIEGSFGSYEGFRTAFSRAATGEFGSGWAWLVIGSAGRLRVISSSDADNPLQKHLHPLLTLDVWEHAYYVDYRNERGRYVEAFLDHLVNWDFVATNLERGATEPRAAGGPPPRAAGSRGSQRHRSDRGRGPRSRSDQAPSARTFTAARRRRPEVRLDLDADLDEVSRA